ncbi:TPR-like protein [Sistotremastrum suecicum HHB10207 ss-3]|uniref:TPR-like protein n=1 Tax=Sistotremastrum suecicum HHB10207 ss-3 TaxID=1314776 RepID=A0A166D835_9AGAM|nr:TPR-like protein [Sistotremastrum suecicum HHB10207 ss-3]
MAASQDRNDGPRTQMSSVLRALKSIVATSSLPYPQAIASSAVMIYEEANKQQSTSQNLRSLVDKVLEIAWNIASALQDTDSHPSEALVRNVGQLLSTLQSILDDLRSHSSRGGLSRLLGVADVIRVRKLEDDLDRAMSLFLKQTQLANVALSGSLSHATAHHRDEFEAAILQIYQEQAAQSNPQANHDANIDATLPAEPQHLFGRSAIIATIVGQLCASDQAHVAVVGAPGIGKTTVALAVLYDGDVASVYGRNRHFISCETVPTAENLQATLGDYFELKGNISMPRIISRLKGPNPTLLVLDNFETPWEPTAERVKVEEMLSALADIPNLSILLTIRGAERPAGIAWKRPFVAPLPALQLEAAKQLFLSLSDAPEDDIYLPKLLEEVDHVPLAVTLLGNLGQHTDCKALLDEWIHQKNGMLTRGFDGRLSSVEVSIQVSLSSQRLAKAPLAVKVLQVLSLLPDGVTTVDLSRILQDQDGIAPAISALRQVALSYAEPISNRIRALSPIREYVQKHMPIPGEDLAILQDYFFRLTKTVGESGAFDNKESLSALRSQTTNIFTVLLAALQRADAPTEAILSVLRMGDFIYTSSLSRQLLPLATAAAKNLGDRRLEIDCINTGYRLYHQDASIGLKDAEDRLAILDALEDVDERSLALSKARTMKILADCARRLGQFDSAIEYSKRAIAIYSAHDDYRHHADTLRTLAWTQLYSAEPHEVMQTLQEALSLTDQHDMPLIRSALYSRLAQIYASRCLFPLAEEYFRKAEQLQAPITGESQDYVTNLYSWGEVLRYQGSLAEAHRVLLLAERVSVKLGHEGWVATVTEALGSLAMAGGDAEKGKIYLHAAFRQYAKLKWIIQQAKCLTEIGDVEYTLGNYSTAWAHLCEVRRVYRGDGHLGVMVDAEALAKMGNVALKLEKLDDARNCFIVSSLVFRKISDRVALSSSIQGLGDLFLQQQESNVAKACYGATLDLIKYTGVRKKIAECLMRLAGVQEDRDGASRALEKARLWFKRAEDPIGEAKCTARIDELIAMTEDI